MIRKVKNINFLLNSTNDIYKNFKTEIEECWKDFCQSNSHVFNGDVLSVLNIEELNQNFTIDVGWIKFCDVIYGKLVGNIKTRTLFLGGYLLTNDNYICLAQDQNNIINLIGGMASVEDFVNNEYKPELCLIRECKEEIGLDITNNNFNYNLRYLKYPVDTETSKSHYPVGLIYEIKTKYSKQEINNFFVNGEHDNEIESLIFFKPSEYHLLNEFQKKDYIDNLCELISEDYK